VKLTCYVGRDREALGAFARELGRVPGTRVVEVADMLLALSEDGLPLPEPGADVLEMPAWYALGRVHAGLDHARATLEILRELRELTDRYEGGVRASAEALESAAALLRRALNLSP
jgi:hypothetical protein